MANIHLRLCKQFSESHSHMLFVSMVKEGHGQCLVGNQTIR